MYSINHPPIFYGSTSLLACILNPYNFIGNVSSDRSRLKFAATKDATCSNAMHTFGSKLGMLNQLVLSLQGALTITWATQTNNTPMRRNAVVKEYIFEVPCRTTIENKLRDPTY
jgi:hypothetical protein